MPKPPHERALEGIAKLGIGGLLVLGLMVATAYVLPGVFPQWSSWVRGSPPALAPAPASQPATSQAAPIPKPIRTLVVIIPGTHGSEGQWPMVIPGQATFGSELLRAAGPNTDVYPLVWYSSISHPQRKEATGILVDLLNTKGAEYDRICLVGHSHGGNIALWAAGECKPKIDLVVCLSTPFVCLQTRGADGKVVDLPVYCSPRGRKNIGKIVTLVPDTDGVPDGWADIDLGLSQNEAIRLTREWQEQFNHPRLKDDGWFSGSNLTACRNIDLADLSVTMQSSVTGTMGIAPHGAVHSRRMGSVIGRMVRDGVTDAEAASLRSLIQPAGADVGWPISQAQQEKVLAETAAARELFGWRLDSLDVELNPPKPGKSVYFFARLTTAGRDGVKVSTPFVQGTKAHWPTKFILPAGKTASLEMVDDGYVWNSTLGTAALDGTAAPPSTVTVSHGKWSWTATMGWTAVHY